MLRSVIFIQESFVQALVQTTKRSAPSFNHVRCKSVSKSLFYVGIHQDLTGIVSGPKLTSVKCERTDDKEETIRESFVYVAHLGVKPTASLSQRWQYSLHYR